MLLTYKKKPLQNVAVYIYLNYYFIGYSEKRPIPEQ